MAVQTTDTYRSGVGNVWVGVMNAWLSFIADATATFSWITTTRGGFKAVRTQVVVGANTTENYYIDYTCLLANTKGINEVVSSPGWITMPLVQPPTQGGRTTKTNWATTMAQMRRDIWTHWTGATLGGDVNNTFSLPMLTGSADIRLFTVQLGCICTIDSTCITVATIPAGAQIANNTPPPSTVPIPQPVVSIEVNAAPAPDLAALVQAIQDAGSRSTLVALNQEGAVYAVESGEIIDPP